MCLFFRLVLLFFDEYLNVVIYLSRLSVQLGSIFFLSSQTDRGDVVLDLLAAHNNLPGRASFCSIGRFCDIFWFLPSRAERVGAGLV